MAITVASDNQYTYNKVLDLFDLIQYAFTYFAVDPKSAEEPGSTKKVQVALVIYAEPNDRTPITKAVADNFNDIIQSGDLNFGQAVIVKGDDVKNREVDLVVRMVGDKPQVLRVQVKPVNQAGSGGGSSGTKVQEAGQCLYAALRYRSQHGDLTAENVASLSPKDWEDAWNDDCECPGVTIEEIKGLSPEWQASMILGANQIKNTVNGSNWKFERGGTVDNQIGDAYSRAMKNWTHPQQKFTDRNKWNPADFWMIQKGKETEIIGIKGSKNMPGSGLKGENTIDCLNNFMEQAFDGTNNSKDVPAKSLIGISLKQIRGSASMTVKNQGPVAARRAAEQVGFLYPRTSSLLVFDNGTQQVKNPDRKWPMDVYIAYKTTSTKNKDSFQCRNFGGDTKGDWKLELKGITAAQGKIQGQPKAGGKGVFYNLLETAGFGDLPSVVSFNQCEPQSPTAKSNAITMTIYNLLKKFKAIGLPTDDQVAKSIIKGKSQSYRYSKINGLKLLEWLYNHRGRTAGKAVKEAYLYAASLSDKSSVYYKLM